MEENNSLNTNITTTTTTTTTNNNNNNNIVEENNNNLEYPETPKIVEEIEKSEESNELKKKKSSSVSDYGGCADQNYRHRRRMEDAHYVEDGFNGNPKQSFFSIYDGHGGKEAALFASQNLHQILKEELQKNPDSLSTPEKGLELLEKIYLLTDEKMLGKVPPHHGCTAVTCLITEQNEKKQLFTANAGDARAVLCRDGKAIRLTKDHKASDEEEAKRILDSGGHIINGRVNAQIIITRSLGDHLMKTFIIAKPYTHHEYLTDKDQFLIIACDGLWDVLEDQKAVDFVLENQHLTCSEISKKLLIKALDDGSTDNLSVIVVKI